ncbi:peptidylprolyl isomerase [Oleiphilus sp. HI0009]|nr:MULTISPECIES: FKBP-type peptidyl-prolyl cis-trans isomerase [unclassified Oleiphilus]KZX72556.1 peptidylprolyl isomerase [Oleiphilus sp. HI0009]MCH2158058.1 FKBP-type peptidyl-prolyl cis-trans isomerase [Oleiphilaceae bacterium]KZY65252.1 peptidylprolyl isomerase [Oleiphilus sp. HI0066]KZY68356.1 peptidylprolyl isomerase [Oleiphilus sp. HI0067]KZY69332.1 peptidylprolyl isomerase [Oleiphilus sp. HI0067]
MNIKKIALPLLTASLIGMSPVTLAEDGAAKFESKEAKVSYAFGVMFGQRMRNELKDIDLDQFANGLKSAFNDEPQLLTDDEIAQTLSEYQREMQEKQIAELQKLSEANKIVGEEFLSANKDKEGVVTLESGLQYKVLTEGKGPQPAATDTVTVHYTGSLISGEVFDSSVSRGEPATFPLNGVIAGWTEALQLMPTGSKWQLYIPADLAYGPQGNRSIGPNETLLFEVELIEIAK